MLGLMTDIFRQGSRYAAQITLSQIIDVYVALAHNDNATAIEPLHCSLSSRVCLASQYAYLQSAVNEGKTLTRISEENIYVKGEGRGVELEDKRAQTSNQSVPVKFREAEESASDDKENSTLISSEREKAPKSPGTANGGSNHPSNTDVFETDIDRTAVNNEIDSRKAEPEEEKQSLMSTVKADGHGHEGDYDIFLNLCFKPGTCSCSSCTNMDADTAAAASDTHEIEEDTEHILRNVPQNAGDTALTWTESAGDPNDIEGPGIDTNIQGSMSSRTLESEDNEPEEDLFSQANIET